MRRPPPRTTSNDNLFPYTTHFRSKPRLGTEFDEKSWDGFKRRLRFHALDAGRTSYYAELANALGVNSERITVCYLATAPHLFITICQQLAKVGLNHANLRIVLEKPLGHDLESSNAINAAVGQHFAENQIYRIDHYLGKESVQNLKNGSASCRERVCKNV